MERGGRLSCETCVALDGRWALGRVHLGVLHPAQQLVRGDSIQVLFHLMKLKHVFLRDHLRAFLRYFHRPLSSRAHSICSLGDGVLRRLPKIGTSTR
jgi:hypothetical protein